MFKNFLLYFFFSLIFANISYSNDKVVFIEINYIFKNSNVGKELNLKILDEDKKLNQEINNYRKKIDDEKNKILSQKNVLSVEEYNKKIVVLEDYIKNINLEIKKKNDDFKFKIEEWKKNNI